MTFASFVNVLTVILCSAVLVQCWRMGRALRVFRETDLPATVAALSSATHDAEIVLAAIRTVLAREVQPRLQLIADAGQVADELGVMIGIADAAADRLLDCSRAARGTGAEVAA